MPHAIPVFPFETLRQPSAVLASSCAHLPQIAFTRCCCQLSLNDHSNLSKPVIIASGARRAGRTRRARGMRLPRAGRPREACACVTYGDVRRACAGRARGVRGACAGRALCPRACCPVTRSTTRSSSAAPPRPPRVASDDAGWVAPLASGHDARSAAPPAARRLPAGLSSPWRRAHTSPLFWKVLVSTSIRVHAWSLRRSVMLLIRPGFCGQTSVKWRRTCAAAPPLARDERGRTAQPGLMSRSSWACQRTGGLSEQPHRRGGSHQVVAQNDELRAHGAAL
eukprot:5934343-Prymnesium_polylepis.1